MKYKPTLLERLMQYLILNSNNIHDIGLFHGKMGVALCFCEYSRYIENELYLDFATELVSEVYDELTPLLPIDLENGICGIGWGIQYLITQNYMVGCADDILMDIDKITMERDVRRITDKSLTTGIGGIVFYILSRLTATKRLVSYSPFDCGYLLEVAQTIHEIQKKEVKDSFLKDLFTKYLLYVEEGNQIEEKSIYLPTFFCQTTDFVNKENLSFQIKGLDNGIAGVALKLMRK